MFFSLKEYFTKIIFDLDLLVRDDPHILHLYLYQPNKVAPFFIIFAT